MYTDPNSSQVLFAPSFLTSSFLVHFVSTIQQYKWKSRKLPITRERIIVFLDTNLIPLLHREKVILTLYKKKNAPESKFIIKPV
jgi:hypothetical protein